MKCHVHSGQFIRRYTLLDPLDESLEFANRLWTRASSAMGYSRSFEVAVEVLNTFNLLCDSLVVVFGPVREDELISQTVPSDELAVAGFKQ